MESYKKAIDKLCNQNKYGIKMCDIRLHVLTVLFLKSASDLAGGSAFNYIFSGLCQEKDIGTKLDLVIKNHLSASEKFQLPKFSEIEDLILKEILALFLKFDFTSQVFLDNDMFSFTYDRINRHYFNGSANPQNAEFITPPDVCRLMSKLLNVPESNDEEVSICDPCCGTGAMLTAFIQDNPGKKVKVYGQDINHEAVVICRMNVSTEQLKVNYLKSKAE